MRLANELRGRIFVQRTMHGGPQATHRPPAGPLHNRHVSRTPPDLSPKPYWLYLLECEGGVYYAGIALDVEQRFFQHVFGLGAKFTRARPPLRVLAAREYPDKGAALRAEIRLKALPRARKLAFFDA
jgi:putative endonuclease